MRVQLFPMRREQGQFLFSILNKKDQNLLQILMVLESLYILVLNKNDINDYIWKKNAMMLLQIHKTKYYYNISTISTLNAVRL